MTGKNGLTPRQVRFVDVYLRQTRPNVVQAMLEAGFSKTTARSQGNRLLKNKAVAQAIKQRRKSRSERTKTDADFVLTNLRNVFERAMQIQPVLDRQGNPIGQFTFQGGPANKSLELMGRHLGMFPQKIEVTLDIELKGILVGVVTEFPDTKPYIVERLQRLAKGEGEAA